jgi:hypothetical protein
VCYPYPITLYHYTGTIEEGVQALSQKFGVDFQQIVDFEKRFYDPRPRLRSEIFDGMSIWGQSIIDGVKDGTIVFYERNEDINDRLDNLWLWQRFLLFNKNYPNMVYHIS